MRHNSTSEFAGNAYSEWLLDRRRTDDEIPHDEIAPCGDIATSSNELDANAAVAAINEAVKNGRPMNAALVEGVAAVVHDERIKRCGTSMLKKTSYAELPENEKMEYRNLVKNSTAILLGVTRY
jgi:hypothetical protein